MAEKEIPLGKKLGLGVAVGWGAASLCGAALPAALIAAAVGGGLMATLAIADKVTKVVTRKR